MPLRKGNLLDGLPDIKVLKYLSKLTLKIAKAKLNNQINLVSNYLFHLIHIYLPQVFDKYIQIVTGNNLFDNSTCTNLQRLPHILHLAHLHIENGNHEAEVVFGFEGHPMR